MNIKKQFPARILVGGVVGLVLAAFCYQPLFRGGFSAPALCRPLIQMCGLGWAAAITCALLFALGAAAGIATLPFAEEGRNLVVQSLAHFAVTAVFWSLLLGLCFGMRRWQSWLLGLAFLVLVYVLIWLGRWVGWYAEVAAIREKLGLAPGPSPLKWKETLPYLPFAFLLCLLLPAVLRLCDDRVPLLSILYGVLLLPVGGFFSGLSLGRRHGFCPLYPVACGVVILLFIPLARLFSNMADGVLIPIAVAAALLGDLAGAGCARARRKRKEREIK